MAAEQQNIVVTAQPVIAEVPQHRIEIAPPPTALPTTDDNLVMGPDDMGHEGSARVDAPALPAPAADVGGNWLDAHSSPAAPGQGNGPMGVMPMVQPLGDPAPYPPPSPAIDDATIYMLLAVAVAIGVGVVTYRLWKKHGTAPALALIRGQAPAIICAGLAITAAGMFFRYMGYEGEGGAVMLFRQGFVAFFGVLVTLVGLYHWMTRPKTP